jgi:hypothetical protein
MAIVNPHLKDGVRKYQQEGTIYSFCEQPWLGQIVSLPNDQGYLEILWYHMEAEEKSKRGKTETGRLYKSSIHQETLMMWDFSLNEEKIPDDILNETRDELHDLSDRYKLLCGLN